MKNIKIVIVGAGSSYTPELIEGILSRPHEEIPLKELCLVDKDKSRLGVMAALAGRMIKARGRGAVLESGDDLAALAQGADFVITQIRVGGMPARHLDESIPLKYGMIGQETTGPGGMFKALRTIPPMVEIGKTVARVAPKAFILNYTNPSGIIAEAVLRHSGARLIGLCSGIPGLQQHLMEKLSPTFPDLKTYSVGLNHLGFIYKITQGGQDIMSNAITRLAELGEQGLAPGAPMRLEKIFNAIPMGYLRYFFLRSDMFKHQKEAAETRAQQVMKIEKDILEQAKDEACVSKPAALVARGGGGYSDITFSFLGSILHGRGEELVCSVLNQGAVEGLPADAGVELSCSVGAEGAKPLPVGAIPLAFRGVVQAVKAYESLTVEAAMKRDRKLAVQALLNHPLAGDLDQVEPLVDEMLKAHKLEFS